VKDWPALDLSGADDLVLAALDDFQPTAVEEGAPGLRVFFASAAQRDAALATLSARDTAATAVDVSDEDWAARSQQSLQPITVGQITIDPKPFVPGETNPQSLTASPFRIVINPSMGFGTGHHATTRMCLAALQLLDLRGGTVLDAGTGSGVLALAAVRLGAARADGIDNDADAIQSAQENLHLNQNPAGVRFAVLDLTTRDLAPADVVVANLTGSMLVKVAGRLLEATRSGGHLILSGILSVEEEDVRQAFAAASFLQRSQEDEWVCLMLKKP